MWKEIKKNYRLPMRFVLALPLIAAVPIAIEAVQHLVEWRIGMFDSIAGAQAVEAHPARMAVGYAKTAALLFAAFWVWRFLSFGGDRARTLRVDRPTLRLFAPVVAFHVLLVVGQVLAGTALSAWFPAGGTLIMAGSAAMLAAMALELYLAPWKAGAAAGDERMTPGASVGSMSGNIAWSFAFTLLMFFPAMVLHYALNGFAIGRPGGIVLAMLAADSLLVGYIAALFPTTVFLVARRAAERASPMPVAAARPLPA